MAWDIAACGVCVAFSLAGLWCSCSDLGGPEGMGMVIFI